MIIRFYYNSFPCLHGASVYQYAKDRTSLDVGLSLLDCPCVLLTVAKVRTFSTPQKLFESFFAKNVFFFDFSVQCTFAHFVLQSMIQQNAHLTRIIRHYQRCISIVSHRYSAARHIWYVYMLDVEHAPRVCTHVRMYARVYVCVCVHCYIAIYACLHTSRAICTRQPSIVPRTHADRLKTPYFERAKIYLMI